MPVLRLKNTAGKGQVWNLDALTGDARLVIGRDLDVAACIADQGASRRHAELFRVGELLFLRDLKSKNGTFLNDEPVGDEELLQVGDKIKIGQTVFIFEETLEEQARAAIGDVEFRDEGDDEDSYTETFGVALRETDTALAGRATGYQRKLQALFAQAQMLAGDYSSETIVQETLRHTARAVNAGCAFFFVRTEAGKVLPRGVYKRSEKEQPKVSRSIVRTVMKSRRAVLTADASADQRFADTQSVIAQAIRSVLCVPISTHDRMAGALYLTNVEGQPPFSQEDLELVSAMGLQAGVALETLLAKERVRKKMLHTLKVLISLVEERDPKLQGHSVRVQLYAGAIARQLQLPHTQNYLIQTSAVLHDIGKLTALGSPPRTPEEHARLEREHPDLGVEVIRTVEEIEPLIAGIKYHHEYLDGSGFPRGVKGADIPMEGRIICVANDFDILTCKDGREPSEQDVKAGLQELCVHAGRRYDDDVVGALVRAHRTGSLFQVVPLFQDLFKAGKEG